MRALIGSSGFVGGNLLEQATFDATFRSTNIGDLRGARCDLLLCAGAPAAKWKANKDPAADLANLQTLFDVLETVEARRAVLVSTIDVYGRPIDVDEGTPVDPEATTAYGRHRRLLEQLFERRFENRLILRLPGLFGPGLRKNVIFDLLHDNEVHKIHPGGVFQYYDTRRLWSDVERATKHGLSLVNVSAEPISTAELARTCFDRELESPAGAAPARYDMRSRHAALWGGRDGYLYSKADTLARMAEFVANERAKR